MRRRAPIALAAAVASLAAPAAAQADDLTVLMPGRFFDPARSTIVSGDHVTFRNADLVTHDVRIAAGPFDSGPLLRAGAWTHDFETPGEYPFVCTLHAFMSGTLSVVPATLSAAPGGVLAGRPVTFSGRTRAGTAAVGIERSVGGGAWEPVATATPAADGTFSARAPAVEGASFRATTPAGASFVVTPDVTARIDLHVSLERGRRQLTLMAHAQPAPAGTVLTLERYARWRYRWLRGRSVRLGDDGMATFRLPAKTRTYVRVALRPRGGHGPALVRSHVLRTSDGRTARDPDLIAPPGPGHHGGAEGEPGGHGGHA